MTQTSKWHFFFSNALNSVQWAWSNLQVKNFIFQKLKKAILKRKSTFKTLLKYIEWYSNNYKLQQFKITILRHQICTCPHTFYDTSTAAKVSTGMGFDKVIFKYLILGQQQ